MPHLAALADVKPASPTEAESFFHDIVSVSVAAG